MLLSIDGLSGISLVEGEIRIENNVSLENLDGLANLTTVNTSLDETLSIWGNTSLPYCEICELLDQLTTEPFSASVFYNLEDSCGPPFNCP